MKHRKEKDLVTNEMTEDDIWNFLMKHLDEYKSPTENKRKDQMTKDDIWNAVIKMMGKYDFPTENQIANEVFIVFNYYSEMESGGHESLFTWFSWHIEKVGITNYLKELTGILEKIGAYDYSKIEKEYGEELWKLFKALENNDNEEEDFSSILRKANNEYKKLDGKLGDLLETYFVSIYTELIEVVED
ncbi:hypothetical protein [Neobacillus sp. DY30]|uniref:DMP19 family protein n=1 Tax=Neobacillus sp. DY30 TaxID=3047871 RepID=UPI0024BFD78D|nr:hypothetical protein [Neobacillus sp. DY30]WHY02542.1 hypothetical protein QNH29_10070 [Neobacillus sp. DY30]